MIHIQRIISNRFDMDPLAVNMRKIASKNYSNILYHDAKTTRKY